MEQHYDVIVLGAGNAGFAPAGMAKEAGKSVLVIDGRDFGGTCALRGCVPKKVLVAAGDALNVIADASEHKIDAAFNGIDWPALIARKETFVEGVPDMFEGSLTGRNIDTAHGAAKFTGPGEIEINGETVAGGQFVIATGSAPRNLPIPGFEHAIDSDAILDRAQLPKSLVFIGAGVIGLEFAHVFARAGTHVTILEVADTALAAMDQDIVAALVEESGRIGIDIHTGVATKSIAPSGDGFKVTYEEGGKSVSIDAEVVANGAGRVAAVSDLDLDAAGIDHDGPVIALNENLQSVSNPAVFVAGDANAASGPQLSPVATYEGRIVGNNIINPDALQTADYLTVPRCVFTIPAMASVGYSPEEAEAAGLKFEVKLNDLKDWRSAKTYAERAAVSKVLIEDGTERILGAHLLGHGAPETIHIFALAMSHNISAADLRGTVYAYPTFTSDIKNMI
ncbi:MAG: NAD(P)/FAD-dependent oxidoreductase [Rhodospirillaceae bacterium]|jgi:glutathione reductase (NADPH)|nr:NAD(P)/FAD-dependent oxidoreductase [Rhodospirillaceae bacterium]MBT4116584.1 NAD(P)/FAD-dependent oxidoreductase [Rhodospirillaceae bacterium]MBT4671674.1 NAD(P)/FAD-dependent oxidoreductase [Rhodospirillaceae bacterium]MBT4717920.1 NAD(P)/FAD-dependent oxidoreductase [Rhodospirillaceae bacterium]MBT4747998.1 NAD(P)/FAD-dependent oxidoreductase [Rhodospirillaceae bacterium]